MNGKIDAGQISKVPCLFSGEAPAHRDLTDAEFDQAVHEQLLQFRRFAPNLATGDIVVALDLDGTIVDGYGQVSVRVKEALQRVHASGAQLVIATGRSVAASAPVARVWDTLPTWAICSNGAVIGRFLNLPAANRDQTTLSGTAPLVLPAPGEPYFETRSVHNFDPRPYIEALLKVVPNALFGVEDGANGFRVSQPFPDGELAETVSVEPLEELWSRPVSRIVMRAPDLDLAEFSKLVSEANLSAVEYAVGWTSWLDVSGQGVNKASGLQELLETLRMDRDRLVCLGDGSNDVDMLAWARCGIAMQGHYAEILEASHWQTASVWEDGAAMTLAALAELRGH